MPTNTEVFYQQRQISGGMSWGDEIKEFEQAARRAPLGDAEAYGCTVHMVEEDSDDLDDVVDDLVEAIVIESTEDESDEDESDEDKSDEDEDDIYV